MALGSLNEFSLTPDRRSVLKWTSALAGATGAGLATGQAQPVRHAETSPRPHQAGSLRKGMFGYTLAHEQFPVPELVRFGGLASRAGFPVLATSDHLQPWQANEGHSGQAWVTMGAQESRVRAGGVEPPACRTRVSQPAPPTRLR